MFGFFGFECASSLFAVVKDPQKNVPKALTISIGIVGIIYLLFVTSIVLSTPLSAFAPGILLPDILRTIFPTNTWIITAIHISMLSAILGTIHSMIWSSSALMVSLFKQLLGGGLPARLAVLIVGFCIFLSFTFLKNIGLFFALTAMFVVTAYALSIITLLTIKEEWKGGKNLITIGGLIMAGVIFYFSYELLVQSLS